MAGTHDNGIVKRVLPPFIPRKTLDGKVRFQKSLVYVFIKTDHVNLIVGSIIVVLVKLTFFFNPAKNTVYCIGQFIGYYSTAEFFALGWSQYIQHFLLKA